MEETISTRLLFNETGHTEESKIEIRNKKSFTRLKQNENWNSLEDE